MRAIVNLIWLCIFLLSGGQHLYADTHTNTICDSPAIDFVKKQQVKVKTAEPGSVLIEEADIDLDEEFHSSDDLNKGGSHKLFTVKHGPLDNWYLPFFTGFLYKVYFPKNDTVALQSGGSNPIYLKIGVLRI